VSEAWFAIILVVVILAGTYWSGYKKGRDSARADVRRSIGEGKK
jgi:hypothetical protein